MKVRLFAIEYDTDESQPNDLPKEIITTLNDMGYDHIVDGNPNEFVATYGADYISDKTGWLVFEFEFEILR